MPATPIFIFVIYTDGPKKKKRVEPAVRRWWVKQAGAWPDRLVLRMHNCWRLRKLTQAVITTLPLIRWALERRRAPVPPAKGTTPTDVSHSHWVFFLLQSPCRSDLGLSLSCRAPQKSQTKPGAGRSINVRCRCHLTPATPTGHPAAKTNQAARKLVPRWRQRGGGSQNFSSFRNDSLVIHLALWLEDCQWRDAFTQPPGWVNAPSGVAITQFWFRVFFWQRS